VTVVSEEQREIISVLVENKSGVLARIAGLFSGRGFNIASLSVGETDDPEISRITIVVEEDPQTLEQVVKQLQKLVVTVKVEDFSTRDIVGSELVLVKFRATASDRSEVMELIDIYDGEVIDVTHSAMTAQFVGDEDEIEDVLELLEPYGIKEIARTGTAALAKINS
jgi:acetolactate synthase-1/3 small subunit